MVTTVRTPARVRVRRTLGASIGVLLVWALYTLFAAPPVGLRTARHFDPDRMAALELDMWQAYYRKENVRLFKDLVVSLHEQYHYTWANSVRAAFHLARAAATFGNMRADYERVLPDLERAFAIARDWTGAHYDPAAVARAELAWWVARREPGKDSAEQVGRLIAETYALMYETPIGRVEEAALLRARAARLRDEGGERADWITVGTMLRASYRSLAAGVDEH